jgi:quercetin dioxygenase-like cupin family protein
MSGIIIPTGLSLVTKGHVTIKHRDREINLNEGEFAIVSNGTEHFARRRGRGSRSAD